MEQKQRFTLRKFKTGLGSILLTSLLLSSPVLQMATVLAEETQPALTQQDLANATNLKDPKLPLTDLVKALQEQANTNSGELVHSVTSQELEAAIKAAETAGVSVTKADSVTRYDSLEASQEDYSSQLETITAIVNQQLAAQEAFEAAQVAYKDYLTAEAAYQQDKSQYDAYLVAKAAYEEAFATYQTAFQAYEKALADNVKAIADYEKEKLAYGRAYTLYQDQLAQYQTASQANEAKRLAYEAALAQYQTDQAAYETALAAYETAQGSDAAAQAQYERELEQYNAEYAIYQPKLEAYNRQLEEAQRRTQEIGNLSSVEVQTLSLQHSRDPKVTLSNLQGISFDTWTIIHAGGSHEHYINDKGQPTLDPNQAFSDTYDPYNGDRLGGAYHLYSEKGNFSFTATHTNVEGITKDGKPVSKVVYEVSGTHDTPITMAYYEDPVDFLEWARRSRGRMQVTVKPSFYDENGNKISLANNSLLHIVSLDNNHSGFGGVEKVTGTGGEFITITGSTVQKHDDEYYSARDNYTDMPGEEYQNLKSIVFKPTSDDFSLTFTKTALRNAPGNYYWLGMQTSLKLGSITGEKPIPPVEPTPPGKTGGERPVAPTPPIKPEYETLEEPKPPVEPVEPVIVEPVKPTEPTPPKEVPEPTEPGKVSEPVAPEAFKITVHKNVYVTKPVPVKGVTNEAGEDVSNGLVPKGATIKFPVNIPDLEPNREETKTFVIEDVIDEGIELDLEVVKAAYKDFEVSYDKDRRLTLKATPDYLAAMNQDLTKGFSFETPDLVGRVLNDGATYHNTIKVIINDYVAHTNTVKVSTPGKPNDPDHPTNNTIEPTKTVVNDQGEAIDGKEVLRTDKLIYPNLWDLDQFATIKNGDKTKQVHIFIEDIDGTKVTPDLKNLTFEDKAKEAVKTPLKVSHVESLDKADKELKELITAAGLADKIEGDFVAIVPEDMAAFEEQYAKIGNSISFNLTVRPKEDATGNIKNTSYQISYGNGYQTKTVENPIKVTTEWEDKLTEKVLKDKVTGDKTEEKGEFTNYRFVETVPTKTGIKHLFERLYTTEWEEEGTEKSLKEKVTDTKTHDKGEFKEFTFVKTVETKTGIKHIFKKVQKPEEPKKSTTVSDKKEYTTEWVNEQDDKLKDKFTGEKTLEAGKIDGYEYVKSVPTATGIKHIFKKVEKPAASSEKPATPVEKPAKKTPLPSTGELAKAWLPWAGGLVILLAVLGRLGLLKKVLNRFKK